MESGNNNTTNDYTLEVDVPHLNNLLSMYNFHPSNNYSETETGATNPLPFTVNQNDAYYCSIDNISQLYSDIEPLYISEVKEIKKNVIDLIYKRSSFEEEDYDEEKYNNYEIDELYQKVKGIIEEFKGFQENLYNAEKNLKKEIEKMNENVKKIDNFIVFLENLSSIDYEETKEIIDKIKELSHKLSSLGDFKKAKRDYATERKNIEKYIYLLRKINKMNTTNMCVVCMDEPVSHFINPCGHTFCKSCLEKSLDIETITQNMILDNTKNCPVCRKYVNNIHPLYFL